ncbi:hypothetical protein NC653_002938 [Populus alba x Populus x berolinensis]|uniref:Uncharacterized protein n=3 Tax=Populus alba x Populus x berolinensis TaxID=444605 RepID=A0AAD6RQ32_9ROSI|nr:hypothetical protein NC653_002938 [Populus alba x Populus x berolinensis]
MATTSFCYRKMEGSLFLNLEGGTPRTQFLQTIPWCSRKLVLTGGNISPMSGTPALEMKGNCLLLQTNTKTLSRSERSSSPTLIAVLGLDFLRTGPRFINSPVIFKYLNINL